MKAQSTVNTSLSYTAQAAQQGNHSQFLGNNYELSIKHSALKNAERILSKIGGGGLKHIDDKVVYYRRGNNENIPSIINPDAGGIIGAFSLPFSSPGSTTNPPQIVDPIYAVPWDTIATKIQHNKEHLKGVMDCLSRDYDLIPNRLDNLYDLKEVKVPETELYYYHPDHLGSSSWITDNDGKATQHLAYLPFGESFVSQRLAGAPARYTFSACRGMRRLDPKDSETGYGYFGARYYESGLSIWLSVDPLSDKYPSLSSYVYCANNPVILVDPDGRSFGDFYDFMGNYLGSDGKNDDKIYIVSDPISIAKILLNRSKSSLFIKQTYTASEDVKVDIATTRPVLEEAVHVYDRTVKNGGEHEEASTFSETGMLKRYPTSKGNEITVDASGNVSIHSHPLNSFWDKGEIFNYLPSIPGNDDMNSFPGFDLNIIVGNGVCDPDTYGCDRTGEAWFYDSNANPIIKEKIEIDHMRKIIFKE